jgi:hypothetical protein
MPATRGRGVQTRSQVGNRNIPPNPLKQNGQRDGGLFGGIFTGIFGTPTVKKTPTPTPQTPPRVTTVPTATYTPTGTMSMQGGTRGQPTTTTTTQKTYCMIVYGQQMQLTSDAINWYIDAGVDVRPCQEVSTPTSNGNLEARVAKLEQYPQAVGTASQKSDQDIWNHLDEHVWSNPPYNNPNAINVKLDKAIAEHGEFHNKLQSLGDSLQSAYEHRTSIEGKLETQITEHGDFHTKLQNLGDADVEAKAHRDSLEKKLEEQRKHTHNSPPEECECGFWDVQCKWNCGWEKYGTIVMIVGGLIGIGILLWLLRPLFSMIGAFKGGAV